MHKLTFRNKLFIVSGYFSDGLKITALVFDSLKFSKQAIKRSLRENIRESVEKTGTVISVFLLSVPLNAEQENSVTKKLKKNQDRRTVRKVEILGPCLLPTASVGRRHGPKTT